jgi:hypothetical protein
VAGGFLLLTVELLGLNHQTGPRVISVIATALGIVLALVVSLAGNSGLRRIIAIVFVLIALVGIFGYTMHSGGRARRAEATASLQLPDNQVVQRAVRSFSSMPPVFSPLSITGMALFGAVVALIGSAEAAARRN